MARILVIDDNADVRAVIALALEAAGHEVMIAADGDHGIEAQRIAPASLVITDIVMPGREGLETIRDLKQEFPGLKIIAMSGAGKLLKTTSHLFTARELGADGILRKPFGSSELLALIDQVMACTAAD